MPFTHLLLHGQVQAPMKFHLSSHFFVAKSLTLRGGRSTVAANEIGNNHLGVYKQPYSPRRLCDCKSGMYMPNWLNNLEPDTSTQETKGTAQSDYSQFHLPQL